jgi:DtxR family transcriptional regulator, Mn-dependent transcriptional regulator
VATSTVEDYLKCIYLEERRSGESVPTGHLATHLKVTPGTATVMAKTLADSGLVSYEPYNGVRLTPAGTRLAANVLRRHRVVELFLVEVMGMNWSEVHGDAELLEHAVSDRLLDRMDEMLGRPTVDPHGDPIPSARGILKEKAYPDLLGCPLGAPLRIARVTDQTTEFLRFLEREGLMPGTRIEVAARDETADTVVVRQQGRGEFNLGFRAASKVLVEPLL